MILLLESKLKIKKLTLFKIRVFSSNFNCETYRYGSSKSEVVQRLRREYLRYGDNKTNFDMEVKEINELVIVKIKK